MTNVKNNTLNPTTAARSAQFTAKAAVKASGNGLRVSTNTKAGKANMNGAAWEKFINQ